jgi:hypothetical protein
MRLWCVRNFNSVSTEKGIVMAGPQFFTPSSVIPSRPRRRFSLEQANKSLPLVRRIVADIVQTHEKATTLQSQLELPVPTKERAVAEDQLESALERLQDLVDELSEVGCELKDYQMGLVDFVGRHQGRDIYLCWKLGEESIDFWHEMQTGFAGRQPVSKLNED